MSQQHLTRRRALGTAGAGVGLVALAACGSDETATDTSTPSAPTGSAAGDSSSAPSTDSGSSADAIATTSDVPEGGGTIVKDAEVVITQPTAGEFKCFSAVCTHQGCLVTEVTETIDCACHFSKFSITDGSVVSGPASAPLAEQAITVDGDSIVLG